MLPLVCRDQRVSPAWAQDLEQVDRWTDNFHMCACVHSCVLGVPGMPTLLYGDLLATWAGSTGGPDVECKGLLPWGPSGQGAGPLPRLP